MMPLSAAITRGTGADPLDRALSAFTDWPNDTTEHSTRCSERLKALHRAFPHIGASVRTFPALARALEAERLIPRMRLNQTVYRQAIHVSLWKVISDMSKAGWEHERIAATLAKAGL